MECTNKCKKGRFSTILWAVMAILLYAAPSLHANVTILDDGKVYNIPDDFGPEVEGDLLVFGTVNLLPGADIEWRVVAKINSTVYITGGIVGDWIDVIGGANVTAYAVSFKVDGVVVPPSEWVDKIINGTLTGYDENSNILFKILFNCHDGGNVTLAVPGGGPVEPIDIQIDIKPGSYPNSINLGSNGVIPVAILSTADFDATLVNAETIFLNGASGVRMRGKADKYLAHVEEVNGDEFMDLVVKIETVNLNEDNTQDGTATLTIHATEDPASAILYQGSDEISIVPPE